MHSQFTILPFRRTFQLTVRQHARSAAVWFARLQKLRTTNYRMLVTDRVTAARITIVQRSHPHSSHATDEMRAPQLDQHATRTMADRDRKILTNRCDGGQVVSAESKRTPAAPAARGQSAVDKDANFVVTPERTAFRRVQVIDVDRVAVDRQVAVHMSRRCFRRRRLRLPRFLRRDRWKSCVVPC